jgi:cysteine synthase
MTRPILDAIGNTPLVELRHVVPPGAARVVAKLESVNPTGSMKDRVALAIGLGFIPPLWKPDAVDEILAVPTDDAKAMARRLAREEAIYAGTSTGANVVAALRVAERLGAGKTVATIIVDPGLRYVSTDVFRGLKQPDARGGGRRP